MRPDRVEPKNNKEREHIMNKNEYNEAYPKAFELPFDIIEHVAKKHNLKLTWELIYAFKDMWAQSRLQK